MSFQVFASGRTMKNFHSSRNINSCLQAPGLLVSAREVNVSWLPQSKNDPIVHKSSLRNDNRSRRWNFLQCIPFRAEIYASIHHMRVRAQKSMRKLTNGESFLKTCNATAIFRFQLHYKMNSPNKSFKQCFWWLRSHVKMINTTKCDAESVMQPLPQTLVEWCLHSICGCYETMGKSHRLSQSEHSSVLPSFVLPLATSPKGTLVQ